MMNPRLALGLSATALAVCLLALVSDLTIYLMHIAVTPKLKQALDIIAFVWPLALAFFAIYLRKVQAHTARRERSASS